MIRRLAHALKAEDKLEELLALADQQKTEFNSSVPQSNKRKQPSQQGMLGGYCAVSIGTSRTEAFRNLTQRAKKRVLLMGIGLSNVSRYAGEDLKAIAARAQIDFLMIDPHFLSTNPAFSKKLDDFLAIEGFATNVQHAFGILQTLCREWNKQRRNRNKMRLRVYSTIQTLSATVIDPSGEHGALELEFYPYQCGQFRPRITVEKASNAELFTALNKRFQRLWGRSRRIV